jgi:hypothetical protein
MSHTRSGYLSVVSEGTLKPFKLASVYVRTLWTGLGAIKVILSDSAAGKGAAGWSELTDPANFVVGSLLLLFVYRKKLSADDQAKRDVSADDQAKQDAQPSTVGAEDASSGAPPRVLYRAKWVVDRFYVFLGLLSVAAALALTVVLSDQADPLVFALTVLLGGVVTLFPGQVALIRKRTDINVNRTGYPKRLRQGLWILELLLSLGAIVLLITHGHTEPWAAIAWGVLVVSFSEFATFLAVVNSRSTEVVFTLAPQLARDIKQLMS